jgi:hypothetical protein
MDSALSGILCFVFAAVIGYFIGRTTSSRRFD